MKIIIAVLAGALAVNLSASASELRVTSILSTAGQGGVPPRIAVSRDYLAVATVNPPKIRIYSPTDFSKPVELESTVGIVSATSDPSGWVAFCSSSGQDLTLLRVDQPLKTVKRYHFDEQKGYSCYGLDLELPAGKATPLIWVGSTQNQSVIALDPWKDKILREYHPVSGAFFVRKSPTALFGVNGSIQPNNALPFVLDLNSGAQLVGDPLGDPTKTTMHRGYYPGVTLDEISGKAWYLRPFEAVAHGFDLKNPSEKTMIEKEIPVSMLRSMDRFGHCLVFTGASLIDDIMPRPNHAVLIPGLPRVPQWAVFRSEKPGEMTELKVTDFLQDPTLKGSNNFALNSSGQIYVAHFNGVSRVDGLLDDLNCQAQ